MYQTNDNLVYKLTGKYAYILGYQIGSTKITHLIFQKKPIFYLVPTDFYSKREKILKVQLIK